MAHVRAVMVVVVTPCRDQVTGMAQSGEQVSLEALVPQAASKLSTEPFCMGLRVPANCRNPRDRKRPS